MATSDSDDYDKVKTAVLQTFALVPEWYHQEFRSMQAKKDQSQGEFFKLLTLTFDR